jgi:hypothetical protein
MGVLIMELFRIIGYKKHHNEMYLVIESIQENCYEFVVGQRAMTRTWRTRFFWLTMATCVALTRWTLQQT